ncbi:MAG: hypothetical protein D6805_01100 [Planctomycetota bacterium]|nr:MAG: hypothetical protein D6805_01100 [Planctomycetota bacterium]
MHDLKLPLHNILGYIGVLEESDLDTQQRLDLKGLESNALFLNKMLEELRVIFLGGRIVVKRELLDWREWMGGVLREFSRVHGLDFGVVELPEVFVEVDGDLLRRIFWNLLENAYFYGGGEVGISSYVEGERLCVVLENSVLRGVRTGKVRRRRRGEHTPTGFGLVVVRSLASRLGLEYEVEGGGERWRVVLRVPLGLDRRKGLDEG